MNHIDLAKARDRLCDSMGNFCHPKPCPMCDLMMAYRGPVTDECHADSVSACLVACMYAPEKATAIISKWNAENPEPRYPTWREWFLTFLPEVPEMFQAEISGLTVVLYTSKSNNYVNYYSSILSERSCDIDNPIPADVAEMLKVSMITPEKGAAT